MSPNACPQNLPDPGAKHSHGMAVARMGNAGRVRWGAASGHECKTLKRSCRQANSRAGRAFRVWVSGLALGLGWVGVGWV